jgi:hypothetical protein
VVSEPGFYDAETTSKSIFGDYIHLRSYLISFRYLTLCRPWLSRHLVGGFAVLKRLHFAPSSADNMAADPSYPLYPIFCIICAALVLLVFTTSFIRQSWNLGVAFLCFWVFWEILFFGIDAVIWADNADIKLYVYCDIGAPPSLLSLSFIDNKSRSVSHVQVFAAVVKPACTLIITRRLYKIAALKSLEAPTRKEVQI